MSGVRLQELLQAERALAQANHQRLAALYDRPFQTVSPDQVAITGADGWQFISDGSNHWEQQFLGQLQLNASALDAWQRVFESRVEAATAIGARFAHLVVPEKQAILPEARWPTGVAVAGERPVQQLLAAVPRGLVYPLARLRDEAWRADLAFRGNSHWSASGNWFGFCELMRAVYPERVFDFDLVSLTRSWWRHDLLMKFTPELVFESVIAIARRAQMVYDNRLFATTGAHVGNHFVLQNPAAPYQEAVVVFGDSYSYDIGFSDLLAAFFGQVHFVWNTMIDFRYCKAMGARFVLVQSAERYLLRPHPSDLI